MHDGTPRLLVLALESSCLVEPVLVALREAGFELAAVGRSAVLPDCDDRFAASFPANIRKGGEAVESAIRDFAPDLVLPLDRAAARLLRALHGKHVRREANLSARIAGTIENSLGAACHYPLFANPAELSRFLRRQRIPAVNAVEVAGETALRALLASVPLPLTVCAGGDDQALGGKMVLDIEAGIAAYRRLTGAISRMKDIVAGEAPIVRLFGPRRPIFIRQHVEGVAAWRFVACRSGWVLSAVTAVSSTGQNIDHPAIENVATLLTGQLALSGLIGFNFVLEAETGAALLLGIASHVSALSCLNEEGIRDLAEALYRSFRSPKRPCEKPSPRRRACVIGADTYDRG